MVIKKLLLMAIFVLAQQILTAQTAYYFIYYTNKPNAKNQKHLLKEIFSQKAIEKRAKFGIPLDEKDFFTDSFYNATISNKGIKIIGKSKWLNGVLVLAEPNLIADSLKSLNFIKSVDFAGKYKVSFHLENDKDNSLDQQFNFLEQAFKNKPKDSVFYGQSHTQITQIHADYMHKNGYWGNNVDIAVFDAGFKNANTVKALKNLTDNNRIKFIYDYVEQIDNVFDDDDHGLAVLSCMAAYKPGQIMGTSPNANYWLFRTENAASENSVEEYFWLLAAEFADSAGIDIINSSLGYTKHDVKSMGHTYKELNGRTTVITKAAEIAAQKGMLVFVSAGNEGNDLWRNLSAPGDAESAITVAAVDIHGHYVGFSSIGPTADKRLKPDLASLGKSAAVLSETGKPYLGNGTSYATPVLCGAAALLVQKHPNTHPQTIKSALLWSASQASEPDKYIGYGVPDIGITDFILSDQQIEGIALAREFKKSVQVIVKTLIMQKVKITLYTDDGKSLVQNFNLTKKGHSALYISKNNTKTIAVKAEFLTTGNSTWFKLN